MDDLKSWAYLTTVVISIGALIYSWLTSRSKANSSAIGEFRSQLDGHGDRLLRLESATEALPELRREIGQVHVRVDDVATTTAKIDGQLSGINRNMDIITKHLLADGGNSK